VNVAVRTVARSVKAEYCNRHSYRSLFAKGFRSFRR